MNAFSLLFVLFACSLSWGLNITVFSPHGNDAPSCLDGITRLPCKTLDYVIQQLHSSGIVSNISIYLRDALPPGVYQFENFINLNIVGQRHRYTRRCTRTPEPSGFIFSNVTDLYLSNFFVRECGIKLFNHSVTMHIVNCKNVVLQNGEFFRCRETALLFTDTIGNVSIVSVDFVDNLLFSSTDQIYSHSGGMEIVFSSSKEGTKSRYELDSCNFNDNTAPQSYKAYITTLRQESEWRGHGAGGGLGIYFQGNSSGNSIMIWNCNFTGNHAEWGAGMHLMFQGEAIGNRVEVSDSKFISNTAEKTGGGVCIRYFRSDSSPPDGQESYNEIHFHQVDFLNNRGEFGAGMTILGTYSPLPSTSKISFSNCTWRANAADFGSAVIVAPPLFQRLEDGHLPIPEFDGCTFVGNYIGMRYEQYYVDFFYQYEGTFVITKSRVDFTGETRFLNNTFSALYIISGRANFKEGSEVLFEGNQGSRGAAIAAYGYTAIVFSRDSNFSFIDNKASELGAGIYYQSFDQHDFRFGRECFLKLNDTDDDIMLESNSTNVLFQGNTANVAGNSIYASTLFPCFFSRSHELAQKDNLLNSDVLDFVGNIQYDSPKNNTPALATGGRRFEHTELKAIAVIPGALYNMPFDLIDEFGQRIESLVALLVTFLYDNITADRKYVIQGSASIRLFGTPGSSDALRITRVGPRNIILTVHVAILECPPGFYLDPQENSCVCSVDNEYKSYYGIVRCDNRNFSAYLLRGFWVGYRPNSTQQPQNLLTAICPLTFCELNSASRYINPLPNTTSNLSDCVCGPNRKGILCGKCRDGLSPFFHSEGFECKSDELCRLGMLFYILSELIPVAILFTVIITLDFSFTSGNINGFIFFSQVLESLSIDVRIHRQTQWLMIIARLFYDIFNFDYFSTNELSFCLFKGATVIDLLAFKYVTVVFALVLVLCLILLMNRLKCSRIEESLNIKERLSVTKGLSAFLVICYLQCARTSFYLLTPVILRVQGGDTGDIVTLFGGLPFFKGRHLFYAIVAILFIVTFVIIPPLLLILYPLLLQLLALCKLSEHWLVCKLLKVFQIYRLKPLIDSFQGCYRDKLRFFAGLYFLYRVMILGGFSLTRSTSQFYVVSQFLLLIFLGVHSIAQPYKNKVHNIIDSCIFLNLVLINACTIFIDVYNVESRENHFAGAKYIISVFIAIQIILVYLPMLCFLAWVGRRLLKFVSQHWKCETGSFRGVFKKKLLQSLETLGNESSSDGDEGLLENLDYHEMRATPTKIPDPPVYVKPETDDDYKPVQIIINKIAS